MFTTSMGPTWDNLTERVAGELLGNAPKFSIGVGAFCYRVWLEPTTVQRGTPVSSGNALCPICAQRERIQAHSSALQHKGHVAGARAGAFRASPIMRSCALSTCAAVSTASVQPGPP